MPHLAQRLDVGVTSIYWCFRSKEEWLESTRAGLWTHPRTHLRTHLHATAGVPVLRRAAPARA